MNDYQDTPTVIGSRGANRGTTNAAAIKAAKRSGETNNLFVTSKNENTNSPIHEFKVLHKGQRAL